MRLTVIFLVLINIVYFAWGSWQASRVGYWLPQEGIAHQQTRSERLVLLAELERKEAVPMPSPMPSGDLPVSQDAVTDSRQCLAVGPFNELAVGELQQRLLALGVDSERRAGQNDEYEDYWVHIPPLPSADSAIRLLRELQVQRIDSFVITQGDLANGISLGLYPHLETATSVSRRLKSAGYNVVVRPMPRLPEQWWLEMDAAAEAGLDASFWGQVAQTFPQLQKLNTGCEPGAIALVSGAGSGHQQPELLSAPGQAGDQ